MKAATYEGKQAVSIREVPTPVCGDNDVLLQNLYASICGTPTVRTFGTRTFEIGTRYAFCDVVNYWIDQSATQDFYAIKCAYGGTAIAPGVTAEKLPIWYADAEWM